MRVLVTGDRHYKDRHIVGVLLDGFRSLSQDAFEDLVVIDGGASGADSFAREWGLSYPDVEHITVEADWDRYGKGAGPIRNREMHDGYKPDVVLAFHDDLLASKGTRDMVDYARSKGTVVYHIRREFSA